MLVATKEGSKRQYLPDVGGDEGMEQKTTLARCWWRRKKEAEDYICQMLMMAKGGSSRKQT